MKHFFSFFLLLHTLANARVLVPVEEITATKAGMQAVAAATVVGTLNHQGNLGKALEDLGKPASLRNLAVSMATAGLTDGLATQLEIPTTQLTTFGEHAAYAGLKAAVSVPVQATLGGKKLGDALASGATTFAADTIGGYFSTQIGKAYGAEGLNYAEHKLGHALGGAAAGAILDPKNPGKGATAGAIGAVVGEVVAESLPQTLSRETRADVGKLAAASAALLTKQEVGTALLTADTALQNNWLLTGAIGGGLAVAANTEEGKKVLAEIEAQTQVALEKERAVGFENLNEAEQFLVGAYHTGVVKDVVYQELDALTGGRLSLVNGWFSKGLQWTGEAASDALKSLHASETLASHGAAFTMGALGSVSVKKLPAPRTFAKKVKDPLKANLKGVEKGSGQNGYKTSQKQADAKPYEVGKVDDLKKRSVGDGMEVHHAPQAHPAQQVIPGYDPKNAPGIVLPRKEHQLIQNLKGTYKGTPRNLLAKDAKNLKKYTKTPNNQILKLIEKTKQTYPDSFKKLPKE